MEEGISVTTCHKSELSIVISQPRVFMFCTSWFVTAAGSKVLCYILGLVLRIEWTSATLVQVRYCKQ